jgi:hypothetical protein
MSRKRELLVLTARRLAGEGIEFKQLDLPRSFRSLIAAPEMMPSPVPDLADSNLSVWA